MTNGYDVYLGKVLLPVTPSKIQTKISNRNETVKLINDSEVSLLKLPGLTEFSFTAMIPNVRYPFAKYNGDFVDASIYLDYFDYLKRGMLPFQLVISRLLPSYKLLFDTNITVTLEEYKITEDAKKGFDLDVDIKLKQYKHYGTKTFETNMLAEGAPVIINETRQIITIPAATDHNVGDVSGFHGNVEPGGSKGGGGSKKKTITVSTGSGSWWQTTVEQKNAGDHENSAYWNR